MTAVLVGIERAVWQVVSQYSKAAPISRGGLVAMVRRLGFDASEREVRETVKQLRRKECMIGSVAGTNGGYYRIVTLAEFEEFGRMEYEAKICDMSETLRVMKHAARKQFGEVYQPAMFGGF
jgi:hypothetical protein